MEVEFYGVRGSIPIANPNFLDFGGNTTCLEILSQGFQLIIDAGSGFKNIKIQEEVPTFLVFSHFHHDHLQGLPFNSSVFSKHHQVHLSSGLVNKTGIVEALSSAFSPPLFPFDLIKDNLFFNIMDFETFQSAASDFFLIDTFRLNHPGGAAGYKISIGEKSLVWGLDHEFGLDRQLDEGFAQAARNSNLVIWDGMFTDKELAGKKGWGHSSIEQGLNFWTLNKPEQLLITHHAPQREDSELKLLSKSLLPKEVEFAKEKKKIKI